MSQSLRLILVSIPLALLVACNQPAAPPAAKAPNPGPPLTPNPMPPSYIGRWAAAIDMCSAGAWVFTDKDLNTAGEVHCDFTQVTPNETGWIAEGSCIAQTPPAHAVLVLNTTRSGADRTLAISGGPFSTPQVLVACDIPDIPAEAQAGAPPLAEASPKARLDTKVKPLNLKAAAPTSGAAR